MSVMPICTVDKNLPGELAKFNAAVARLSPFFEAISNLVFLEETKAISAIENKPLRIIRKNIIKISIKKKDNLRSYLH